MTNGGSDAIECRFADVDSLEGWEAGRAQSTHGDLFCSALLLRAYHRHLFPLVIVECLRGGRVIGGCWGWDRREGGIRRLQHPPTLGYGTLWIADADLSPSRTESLARDVSTALAAFLPRHFDFISVCAAPEFQATAGFQAAGWRVIPEATYRFPLGDVEDAWERLESSRRRNIKHARKRGYRVTPSEDIGALDQVMTAMLERRGAPHPPLRPFLEELVSGLHGLGLGQLFIAQTDAGELAGAKVIVWQGDRAHDYLGAAQGDHVLHHVNTLMVWEAIEWLCRRGEHQWFDLYCSGIDEIGAYKKQFNAPLLNALFFEFTASARLRFAEHRRGMWDALKRRLRGKRYGTPD
ncbi:GNAT family N-acetyltransferase [Candidatus Sumerlaeota bacterium]|nr:GNAT family N-acetyltransferase [Candidatus Sumerlaeota bacterium]